MNSSHRVTAFPSRSLSLRLFLWNLQSDIWKPWRAMVKREIFLDKNWKEILWKTTLCSVNSSPRVTGFPSRSRLLRLFLWSLQRDIWKPIVAYGEKENILTGKLENSFLRNCFVMCDFHSLTYSCILWSCVLALFLWNLRTDISDPFEDYRPKEISSDENEKEVFWETSLWSVNSSHRVTAFLSRSPSRRLFLWNLQSDLCKSIECYGEKGNNFS